MPSFCHLFLCFLIHYCITVCAAFYEMFQQQKRKKERNLMKFGELVHVCWVCTMYISDVLCQQFMKTTTVFRNANRTGDMQIPMQLQTGEK